MKSILYFDGFSWTNVGEGFINIGAQQILKKYFLIIALFFNLILLLSREWLFEKER